MGPSLAPLAPLMTSLPPAHLCLVCLLVPLLGRAGDADEAPTFAVSPARTPVPERLRRRLASGPRKTDLVLLRNGDSLAGTLNKLDTRTVEVEVEKKVVTVKTPQVSAVTLSAELAQRTRVKETSRVV